DSQSRGPSAMPASAESAEQAYVAGCNRVGSDGNGCHYRGDSRVINPQGEIIATADAHQATRIDAELSMAVLREYRDKFPAWRDADEFRLR
ncbi:nitrilase-related carbon-nitrogen hydrolase, partial [Escherichia sp. R-CC3]